MYGPAKRTSHPKLKGWVQLAAHALKDIFDHWNEWPEERGERNRNEEMQFTEILPHRRCLIGKVFTAESDTMSMEKERT